MGGFILVLTGGRTGKTCVCGNYQFVDGKTTIAGEVGQLGGLLTYMARVYKAFPEGSIQLTRQQELDHGEASVETSSGSGTSGQVLGDVQPNRTTQEGSAHDNKNDDGGSDSPEHRPEGDRYGHSRIREAIARLDHADDEHWTQGGKPAVHVVSELLKTPVNRADIDAAAPGFQREGS